MGNCVFCKIINGEIPSNKVFENKNIVAFLDIRPVNPGHTLVVAKQHKENMLDTPEETLKELIVITKKLANAIIEAVNTNSFNIHINNNKAAGQAVPHIHFHIIPRFENDGRRLWKGNDLDSEQAKDIENKIKNLL